MVDLAVQAGVTGVVADMRALPFADGSFDCAVANFVLYHVIDPEISIAELARVLDAGGVEDRLDAERRLLRTAPGMGDAVRRGTATTATDTLVQPRNGRHLLLERFHHVEQVDCDATLVFPTRERLQRYVASLPPMRDLAQRVPDLTEPFRLPVKTPPFTPTRPGR